MLNDKRRSLLNSALFRADNRTEQKTISPFSLALIFTVFRPGAGQDLRPAVPAPPGGALHPVGRPRRGALPGGDEPPGERDGSAGGPGAQRPGPAGLHRNH